MKTRRLGGSEVSVLSAQRGDQQDNRDRHGLITRSTFLTPDWLEGRRKEGGRKEGRKEGTLFTHFCTDNPAPSPKHENSLLTAIVCYIMS